MKKGFTLIELLAVIVILAIIAVIAVPIVIKIIDDSKKNASLSSAEMYMDAVELSIADRAMHHGGLPNKKYSIMSDGNICLENYDSTTKSCKDKDGNTNDDKYVLKVEVNGETPKEGTITIVGGEILHSEIKINEKEIIKDSKGELAYAKTLNEVCTYVKEDNTTPKTAGAKYTCKVDPNKEPYTFYVLNTINSNGKIITESSTDKTPISINLIMDTNISNNGSPVIKSTKKTNDENEVYDLLPWISKEDYGCNEEKCAKNDKGPITIMNFLSEATKNWTNTNEMIIDSFNNDTGASFEMNLYNTYARMPMYLSDDSETEVVDKINASWLYTNLDGNTAPYGYWTFSSYSSSLDYAWRVSYSGQVGAGDVDSDGHSGVRPVITLKLN